MPCLALFILIPPAAPPLFFGVNISSFVRDFCEHWLLLGLSHISGIPDGLDLHSPGHRKPGKIPHAFCLFFHCQICKYRSAPIATLLGNVNIFCAYIAYNKFCLNNSTAVFIHKVNLPEWDLNTWKIWIAKFFCVSRVDFWH